MPDQEDEVVSPELRIAAKRGFIRTTAQSYASTLGAGLPAAAVIVALIQDPTGWLLAGITLALALASPPLGGLASYLNIISKGLPDSYVVAASAQIADPGPTIKEG